MRRIIVGSQADAVEVARILVIAANSLKYYPKLSDIEEMALTNVLFGLRDSIEVEAREASDAV